MGLFHSGVTPLDAVTRDGPPYNLVTPLTTMMLMVCLQEFVMGLSLLLRGTLLEKLEWTFNLYDINGDGIITADELYMIVSSVYDIIGNFTEPRIDENSIRDHVDTVFKVTPYLYIYILQVLQINPRTVILPF